MSIRLYVTFEEKLRAGPKAPSDLREPGLGFKSAYLALALYYQLSDNDEVLRCRQLPMRDDARFEVPLALTLHEALEALVIRHFNPMYLVESLFYAITFIHDVEDDVRSMISADRAPSSTASSRIGPMKKPRASGAHKASSAR